MADGLIASLLLVGFGFGFGLLSAIPTGPVAFLTIRNAAHHGSRAGFATLAGLIAADLVYVGVFLSGLGGVVLETDWLRRGIFLFGALVLGRIGLKSWSLPTDPESSDTTMAPLFPLFREAFAITLTNPALLILFATLLATAASLFGESSVMRHQGALLFALPVGTIAWFSFVIALLARLPQAMADRIRGNVGRVAAVVLLGFSAWLIATLLLEILTT